MENAKKIQDCLQSCADWGLIPTAFRQCMTWEEQVLWLAKFLQETVIPTVNANTDATNGVKAYVENYFENLDVQEEINNKLDEMAESGELADIIAGYIELRGILAYDTVASMKSADNLVDGSFVETYGFYEKGDGGSAKYKVREVTNQDTVDEMYLIALADENLVAELMIESNMSARQFGAKGDGTNDDKASIQCMINKCGYLYLNKGRYLLGSTLTIGQLSIFRCDGTIVYNENDYAIELTDTNYLNMFVKSISSENGGGIKIVPSATKTVSFCKIEIDIGICKSHVIEMDGDNGSISNITFDGIRWWSTNSTPCNVTMTDGAVDNSFVTEIIFDNIDFWSSPATRAGVSTNNASNNEIELKFHKTCFENSWGIHCSGKINSLSLYDCRIVEIQYTQGWLTFDGYLPYVIISGVTDGFFNPEYITISNTASTKDFLTTNLTLHDNVTTYNFQGGFVCNKDRIIPFNMANATKTLDTGGAVTYSDLSRAGGIYNCFSLTANSWYEVTLPSSIWASTKNELYFKTSYAINRVIKDGSATTDTISTSIGGVYRVKKIMGSIIVEAM